MNTIPARTEPAPARDRLGGHLGAVAHPHETRDPTGHDEQLRHGDDGCRCHGPFDVVASGELGELVRGGRDLQRSTVSGLVVGEVQRLDGVRALGDQPVSRDGQAPDSSTPPPIDPHSQALVKAQRCTVL